MDNKEDTADHSHPADNTVDTAGNKVDNHTTDNKEDTTDHSHPADNTADNKEDTADHSHPADNHKPTPKVYINKEDYQPRNITFTKDHISD